MKDEYELDEPSSSLTLCTFLLEDRIIINPSGYGFNNPMSKSWGQVQVMNHKNLLLFMKGLGSGMSTD